MKGNDASCDWADNCARVCAHRDDGARKWRRPGGLALLVAAVALVLAACGGAAGSPDSPHVASLATPSVAGSGASAATAQPNGNATKLVDEWAACERSNGDIHQADPVIDSHGVINITIPAPGQGGVPVGDPHDATGECSQYLVAAQTALRAADPVQDPGGVTNTALIVAFASCMRANGVPNYPYPSGPDDSETNFRGTGVDPNSAAVVKVNDLCGNKLGLPAWWINGWGPPGDITVTMAGIGPNATAPPCVFTKAGCGADSGIPPSIGWSSAGA
jgi:hypothetical protein